VKRLAHSPPERRQGNAVQPERYGAARPEILEAVARHAQDEDQSKGCGQHVPEIGTVAQAEKNEQVVQQQGENYPVDQAQPQVFLGGHADEVVTLPKSQRE